MVKRGADAIGELEREVEDGNWRAKSYRTDTFGNLYQDLHNQVHDLLKKVEDAQAECAWRTAKLLGLGVSLPPLPAGREYPVWLLEQYPILEAVAAKPVGTVAGEAREEPKGKEPLSWADDTQRESQAALDEYIAAQGGKDPSKHAPVAGTQQLPFRGKPAQKLTCVGYFAHGHCPRGKQCEHDHSFITAEAMKSNVMRDAWAKGLLPLRTWAVLARKLGAGTGFWKWVGKRHADVEEQQQAEAMKAFKASLRSAEKEPHRIIGKGVQPDLVDFDRIGGMDVVRKEIGSRSHFIACLMERRRDTYLPDREEFYKRIPNPEGQNWRIPARHETEQMVKLWKKEEVKVTKVPEATEAMQE